MGAELATYDVLGAPITVTTLAQAAEKIEEWAGDDRGRFVCVREVASLMAMIDDSDLASIHHEAAMVTPDGVPLVILGRLKGYDVERTCGPDLMDVVCARSPQSGLKHFFFGGKEGVADKMAATFKRKYPGIEIVDTLCPPFRPMTELEDAAAVERIRSSGADVVWIGLSSPKQDIWMRDNYKKLPQTLIGVGAAFDFHSGTIKRAPKWMRKAGLEWLHRLMSEPKRLWKRYLILAPRFVFAVITDSLFRSRAR